MTTHIVTTTVNAITMISLNRPEKRNAMHADLIHELHATLTQLEADQQTRVVMINGNGEHFCAGADIAWMQKIALGSYKENYDDAQLIADLMQQLYTYTKPTIVLAHGATMGGGLGLLASCDIALAATNAVFGFSEVKIGLAPSTISPYVIAAIGERMARYYFLTGEKFDAKTAHQIGLVHHIEEADSLVQLGMTIAQNLLQNGPIAMTAVKQLIRHVSKHEINSDLAQKTAEHLAHLRASPEGQEGLRSFVEKRPANWQVPS